MRTIIVVGAGIAGMSAALMLAAQGERVTLVEKSDSSGPLLKGFDRSGVHFETGFHFAGGLGRGGLLRLWLETLGLDLPLDTLIPVNEVLCRDGERRPIRTYRELCRDAAGMPKALAGLHILRERVRENLESSPFTCPTRKSMSGILSLTMNPLIPFLNGIGLDAAAVDELLVRSLLYGVAPAEAAWNHFCLVAASYLDGSATLPGGGRTFWRAFASALDSSGIRQIYGHAVSAITTRAPRDVDSVVLDNGMEIPCSGIVFTGHPKTLPGMLPKGTLRPVWVRHVTSLRETEFPIVLYGTVDASVQENTVWYAMHDRGRIATFEEEAPDFCVMTGQDIGRGVRPCTAVAVYSTPPNPTGRKEWKDVACRKLEECILGVLPELCGHWKMVDASTDRAMRRWIYGSTGSIYGMAHDALQMPLTPETKVSGLVLAGQNIILPGMLGCIISGAVAVAALTHNDNILKRFRECAREELS